MSSPREINALSGLGVVLAFMGSLTSQQILAVVGPLLTLAVHVWTHRQVSATRDADERTLTFWREHCDLLSSRLNESRARVAELELAVERLAAQTVAEPAAVTPPFTPAGAATEA